MTKDPQVIADFAAVRDHLENNAAHKGEKGFKATWDTISASGFLTKRTKATDSGKEYDTIQVRINPETVDLNAKLVEEDKEKGIQKEPRNRATIVGYIGSIDVKDNVINFSVGHGYDVKGEDGKSERKTTWIQAEVFNNGFTKPLYDFLAETKKAKEADPEMKMPFVRLSGQLHENNFGNGEDKRYSYRLTARSYEHLTKKQGEEESVTVVEEPQGGEKKKGAAQAAAPAKAEQKAEQKPERKPRARKF